MVAFFKRRKKEKQLRKGEVILRHHGSLFHEIVAQLSEEAHEAGERNILVVSSRAASNATLSNVKAFHPMAVVGHWGDDSVNITAPLTVIAEAELSAMMETNCNRIGKVFGSAKYLQTAHALTEVVTANGKDFIYIGNENLVGQKFNMKTLLKKLQQ